MCETVAVTPETGQFVTAFDRDGQADIGIGQHVNAEHTFVDAVQRFVAGKTLQRFYVQGEFPQRQRTRPRERKPVNDSQILASPAAPRTYG